MTVILEEWIIYLVNSDGSRKPIGLFFGEYSQSNQIIEWIKGGKSTIEILPTSPTEEGYRNKLSILNAPHRTIFRVVPNQIGISAAFAGEKGYVYYFEASAQLVVKGKLRIRKSHQIYEGQHSVYIDASAAFITIRNKLVVIDYLSGDLFLDEKLPNHYREQTHLQFPKRPLTTTRDTVSIPIERGERVRTEQLADRDIRKKVMQRQSPTRTSFTGTSSQPRSRDRFQCRRLNFTKRFFGGPLSAVGSDQKQSVLGRDVSLKMSDRWGQERDQLGTRYFPKVSFGYQFPTGNHESDLPDSFKRSTKKVSNERVKQRDHTGSWFFPKTFFGDVFPSLKRRRPTGRRNTSTEALPALSNSWCTERDQSGTWYFPKTSFGHPLPTAGNESNARRELELETRRLRQFSKPITSSRREEAENYTNKPKENISNEWIEQKDHSGSWFFPKTFSDDILPSLNDRQRNISKRVFERKEKSTQTIPKKLIERSTQTTPTEETSTESQVRKTPRVGVRIPRDHPNYTNAHEYVIYYTIRPNIRQPIATFVGRIRAHTVGHHVYEGRGSDGSLRTVMLNTNDNDSLRDAAIVRHSPDLIVVSANGSAVVKIYDETSSGFEFGSNSVLKINGQLIVSRNGTEEPPITGISSLTVNSGSVSIFICHNNQVILLDEGLNNYSINRVSDWSQHPPVTKTEELGVKLVPTDISPIEATSLRERTDTGYGGGLDPSSQISPSSPSTRSSRSLSDLETSRRTSSPSPSPSQSLFEIRDHRSRSSTNSSVQSQGSGSRSSTRGPTGNLSSTSSRK